MSRVLVLGAGFVVGHLVKYLYANTCSTEEQGIILEESLVAEKIN